MHGLCPLSSNWRGAWKLLLKTPPKTPPEHSVTSLCDRVHLPIHTCGTPRCWGLAAQASTLANDEILY